MSRVLTSNSNFRAEFLEVVVVILILTEILVSVFEAHRGVAPMFTISTVTDSQAGEAGIAWQLPCSRKRITEGRCEDLTPQPPLPQGISIDTSRRVSLRRAHADPTPHPPNGEGVGGWGRPHTDSNPPDDL